MKTENEYAEELIDKCRKKIGIKGFENFKSICIKLAIIDVTNTIEALNDILDTTIVCNTVKSKLMYYQTVLQILKDKL